MDLSLQSLIALARYTVQNPREGARMVMQANVPVPARWMAFAVMAILSAVRWQAICATWTTPKARWAGLTRSSAA